MSTKVECPFRMRTAFPRINARLCELWKATGVEPILPPWWEKLKEWFQETFGQWWEKWWNWFWEWLMGEGGDMFKVEPTPKPELIKVETVRPPLTTGWNNWWGPFGRWGPDYPYTEATGIEGGAGPSAVGGP